MSVTFVSCVPRPIHEDMPHIRPSLYHVEPAKDKDFEVLYIENAIDDVYAGEGKHIQRVVFAEEVAANLARMVTGSQLCIGEDAGPGVFFVAGKQSKDQIIKNHSTELAVARIRQLKWYKNLVKDADDVWNKFRQHRMISDLHRFAAGALKLNREWMLVIDDEFDQLDCPACGKKLPNKEVTVCAECKTIIKPEEHAKKFGQLVKA